jgi:replicative DNA helicase
LNATVAQMPARPSPLAEQEAKLVGAALHLGPPTSVLAALGLIAADFTVELHSKAWGAVMRQAEAGIRVTWETVTSAGLQRRALTQAEAQQLERLAIGNQLDLPTFRLVAETYRLERLRLRMASVLAAEAQRCLAGEFDPAVLAGRLSAHERELHRNAARLEDLTGDQQRLLARWDSNVKEGRAEYLATGIKVLDAEIGGVPRKGLSLIAADAGVGKTALLDSMVHSMLVTHEQLVFGLISPEDGVEHVPKRWLARETGWLLREIGSREMTAVEAEKLQELAARNDALLARVLGYRERSITADQLIATCWQCAERGADVVAIDNFNKINLRGGPEDYHERVQRFSDRLVGFADKAGVAVVLLVHLADTDQPKGKHVSGSGGLQGGKALGRDARLRLDLWRKGRELRATIAKANELGEQGTVIQFSRQHTAGLIDPDTGEKIDLDAERAIERRKKAEETEAERRRLQKKRAAEKEAEKAEAERAKAAAAPSPQAALLEVPESKKPEVSLEAVERPGLHLVPPEGGEP